MIILASGSAIRREILANARISFTARVSHVNESAIKEEGERSGLSLDDLALKLAIAKAMVISAEEPDALVIGADQILGFEGRGYDKPESMEEAADRLTDFAGRTHFLHNGCCVVQQQKVIWQNSEAPALTMRALSRTQIEAYLAEAGPDVLKSVGAYQLEGPGARLFSRIDGNYFTILGLPLLPLADFLSTATGMAY